ncbi:MAG TPA: TRAP transporter TatT component family protein [Vicinamibacterales bacterium]|nr:TRAP transporter TatT component family protein [Vicinamibacterales bacterium]
MPRLVTTRLPRLLLCAVGLAAASGCSLKTMAVKTVANTLSDTGDVFTRDDDPELIKSAIPFGLKLNESLLESVPTHVPLLISTCGGFTQYGYAFVEAEADILGEAKHDDAKAARERALKLYLRAKGYCFRGLEARFGKGTTDKLLQDPKAALAKAKKEDVPLLYWTAAAWGSAIALGIDRPDLVIDMPSVRDLADKALALDEAWSRGAIHELFISLDSLPEALGGSPEKARAHFARALELQRGLSPSPYVALALGVSVPAQNRAEYEQLLKDALAIDPEKDPSNRLVTLVTQRRARALLEQIDTKFAK